MDSALPRWLITGASGFLGSNMGAFLEGRAHRIALLSRPGTAPWALFDTSAVSDLTAISGLDALIATQRPDVIVNAAAMASHEACEANPDAAEAVNSRAAGALAEAAEAVGARYVLISTDAVFDGERGGYREDDAPKPTHVYGRTKLLGEELAGRNPDSLILRTNFFGWSPSGQRSILEFFVNELSAGREVRGFTDFTVTSAYAQALAQAIWDLVKSGASGIVHVTSPDSLTKYDFGQAVAEVFGLPGDLIRPTTMDLDPPRGRNLSLDVSLAERLLGRPLPAQRDGIRRAAADADLRLRIADASRN